MTDKLIEVVKNYPALYDLSNESYRDKNAKENAWIKVANECSVTTECAKKKWKSLRDQYRRSLQTKPKSGFGRSSTSKEWEFQKSLNWLQNFTKTRPSESNLDKSEDDVNENVS